MNLKAAILFGVTGGFVLSLFTWMWNDLNKINCQKAKDRVFISELCKKDIDCTVSVNELMMLRKAERKLLDCPDHAKKD